jgi:hypothetical protein
MRHWVSALFLLSAVGCGGSSPHPAGYAGDDARDFVKKHRAALEKEIGVGSGSTIYDLAILANCQDIPLMGRRLHKRQAEFFEPAGTGDEVVAERLVRFLEENPDLRCLDLELGDRRQMAAGRRHIGPYRSEVTRRGGTP